MTEKQGEDEERIRKVLAALDEGRLAAFTEELAQMPKDAGTSVCDVLAASCPVRIFLKSQGNERREP